jgi:hypothetical protein
MKCGYSVSNEGQGSSGYPVAKRSFAECVPKQELGNEGTEWKAPAWNEREKGVPHFCDDKPSGDIHNI